MKRAARLPTLIFLGFAASAAVAVAALSAGGAGSSEDLTGTSALQALAPLADSDSSSDGAFGITAKASTQQSVEPASSLALSGNRPPLLYRYQVQQEDTLLEIARRFNIDSKYILWNNEGVVSDADLTPGMQLVIPGRDGILHVVSASDSVESIATQYAVDVADVTASLESAGVRPEPLSVGSLILVPNGRRQ